MSEAPVYILCAMNHECEDGMQQSEQRRRETAFLLNTIQYYRLRKRRNREINHIQT